MVDAGAPPVVLDRLAASAAADHLRRVGGDLGRGHHLGRPVTARDPDLGRTPDGLAAVRLAG